ncbi:thioredoxin [Acidihalobacter ferrooxydans]|uniref:Thioredoxin n=1 Tax=Acidihalobacter ferrooxydans TaxID=1765967 RepID=A0A1P8UEV1_9GAMM|nr:thioredoxin [Acidihalobacter ferrooxydans]APZ42383.1 thioredoxin [Acidihalobacter ferrooxydans]
MSDSPYLYDVTQADFAERVLARSQDVPVLVDFWADWCGPCRMLAPVLHKLAEDYGGKLIVAKVNSDAEQALAAQYGIRSLPTVKLFRNGAVVDEFMGVQPESQIRALLDRHIPRESDAVRETALATWRAGDAAKAEALLRQALEDDPGNDKIAPDLAQVLLASGKADEAEQVLRGLPANRIEDADIKRLLASVHFARLVANAPDADALKARLDTAPDDLEALELLAARWILEGHYEAGMDALLQIMRKSRKYNDDAGRRGLLAAFELLGNDDRVTPYRRQMFNLLH